MKYTTSFINQNFLLKVYGYNETGEKNAVSKTLIVLHCTGKRGLRSDSKYKYIDINN